jgi:cell wall-associated NlpC family hydrolase
VGPPAIDAVAAAAQVTYDAFVPWRLGFEDRAAARDDIRSFVDNADVTPARLSAANDALVTAQLALSSAAPAYRAARDALADAVVARARRPVADGLRLSAIWERTDPKRLAVVLAALMQVGHPYVFGMSGPDQFDCSGLTQFAWRTVGVDLVHYAVTQRQQSLDVAPDALEPGDLAFRFRRPGGHVMLYLGLDDLVVQAGGTATGVAVTPWGSVDAAGSPLALPAPDPQALDTQALDPQALDPQAPPSPSLFGRAAAVAGTVGDDIPFDDAFNAAGARYQVAPELLAAIASVTSGYRANAMGLRPAVAADLRLDTDDPFDVIDGAAKRLVDLFLLLGDERAALAAYPTSLGTVTDIAAVPSDPATTAFVDAVETVVRAVPA